MGICQLQYDKLTIRELKVKWLIKSNFINASQRNKKHGRTSRVLTRQIFKDFQQLKQWIAHKSNLWLKEKPRMTLE